MRADDFFPLQPYIPPFPGYVDNRRRIIEVHPRRIRPVDQAKRCSHLTKERHYDFPGSKGSMLYYCDQKHRIRPDRYMAGIRHRIWVSYSCVKCPFWDPERHVQTTLAPAGCEFQVLAPEKMEVAQVVEA